MRGGAPDDQKGNSSIWRTSSCISSKDVTYGRRMDGRFPKLKRKGQVVEGREQGYMYETRLKKREPDHTFQVILRTFILIQVK